jgi:hypothetical protein
LNEKNTNIRQTVHVKTRITIAFPRLGREISLQMCGEVYDIIESMELVIGIDFFAIIIKLLKSLVIPKLIRNKIKEIVIGFKSLHKISYILGGINDGHIPIIAPNIDPKSYYCWEGFHYT